MGELIPLWSQLVSLTWTLLLCVGMGSRGEKKAIILKNLLGDMVLFLTMYKNHSHIFSSSMSNKRKKAKS